MPRDGDDFVIVSETEPLWEPGDVTLTLPGAGTWPVRSRQVLPPETDESNPTGRPVTYTVNVLVAQLEDDHQKRARKALVKALEEGAVGPKALTDAIRWISERRDRAEDELAQRRTGRPTQGPSGS